MPAASQASQQCECPASASAEIPEQRQRSQCHGASGFRICWKGEKEACLPLDQGQGRVAGPPPPGAGTFPRCPGIPRSVEPPALHQSISLGQSINHPALCTDQMSCQLAQTLPRICDLTRGLVFTQLKEGFAGKELKSPIAASWWT